jgi:hypothetical protein
VLEAFQAVADLSDLVRLGGVFADDQPSLRVAGHPFALLGRVGGIDRNHDSSGARDELPVATAVRESRPAYGHYFVRAESGLLEIETGALPLSGPAGYHGAIVVFWPLSSAEGS